MRRVRRLKAEGSNTQNFVSRSSRLSRESRLHCIHSDSISIKSDSVLPRKFHRQNNLLIALTFTPHNNIRWLTRWISNAPYLAYGLLTERLDKWSYSKGGNLGGHCLRHFTRSNSLHGSHHLLRRHMDLGGLIGLVCLVYLVCGVRWAKPQVRSLRLKSEGPNT